MLKITEFLCRLRFTLTALTTRKKEAGVFVLLILVAAGVFAPNMVLGANWEYWIPGWNLWATIRDRNVGALIGAGFSPLLGPAVGNAVGGAVGGAVSGAVINLVLYVYLAIILGISWLIAFLSLQISSLFVGLFSYVAGPLLTDQKWVITRNEFFLDGWIMLRNLADILIVLALVIIALATILRLKEYEAKKLLIPLLIVALLINFSPLFVGIMIDISNILMRVFLSGNLGESILTPLTKSFEDRVETLPPINIANLSVNDTGNVHNKALQRLLYAIIFTVTGISFLYFTFMLLQRYVILAILFIISPLAFALMVFPAPKAKELFNQWWQHFVKWVFIGVGAAFFIKIPIKMLENGWINVNSPTSGSGLANLIIVLGFMVIGARMAKQGAGPVAEATIGIAKKGLMMAATGGAVLGKKIGGWVADRSGLKQGWENVKNKATQFAENNLPGFRTGATAAIKQARHEERINDKDRVARTKAMSKQDRLRELRNKRRGQEAAYDRAAIMREMAADNQLGDIEDDKIGGFATEATQHGAKWKDLESSDYRVAEHNTRNVEGILSRQGLNMSTANPAEVDEARKTARREQLEKNLPNMSRSERLRINPADLDIKLMKGKRFTASMATDFQGSPRHITQLKSHLPQLKIDLQAELNDSHGTPIPTGEQDKAEIRRLINLIGRIERL